MSGDLESGSRMDPAAGRARRERDRLCGRALIVPSAVGGFACSLGVVALALAGCVAGGDPADQVVSAAKKTLALHWVRYNLTFERPRLFDPGSVVRSTNHAAATPKTAQIGAAAATSIE
jgi:hypothetical protein